MATKTAKRYSKTKQAPRNSIPPIATTPEKTYHELDTVTHIKTSYIDPARFRACILDSEESRWLAFRQLALNLVVGFPPEHRNDLIIEATMQCILKFDRWTQSKDPFRYFSSIAYNKMRNWMGYHKRTSMRYSSLETLNNVGAI